MVPPHVSQCSAHREAIDSDADTTPSKPKRVYIQQEFISYETTQAVFEMTDGTIVLVDPEHDGVILDPTTCTATRFRAEAFEQPCSN